MKRLNFKDRRGDEYTFIQFSTGEVKVTKKQKAGAGAIREIDFSAEAIEKLKGFS